MYFLHLILLDFYTNLKVKSIMSHSLWNFKICLKLKFETLTHFYRQSQKLLLHAIKVSRNAGHINLHILVTKLQAIAIKMLSF